MKYVVILIGAAGLWTAGCEMHSPEQTVEGYAQKEAEKQKAEERAADQPQGATNAPKFFND